MIFTSAIFAAFFLYGCSTHPVQKETTAPVSKVQNPPYDYTPLMGFQPLLPSQKFTLKQIDSYVFKFVNPPWGKVNPQVIETWGNDTAYDATYLAPDGSGKSFTIMETKIDTNTPPKIGTPWQTYQKNGKTLYKNNVPGYGTGVAMIDKGVFYLVSSDISNNNGFNITQLEHILQSLSEPVKIAPDMINTQTYGVAKAPTAVPFTAFIPKYIPFKWDTQTAAGVSVKEFRGNKKQDEGRLTLTYMQGNTRLKVIESIGMKYVNPNIAKAQNGVNLVLNGGEKAVYIDGGNAVSLVDGSSSNRRAITWTSKSGVNMIVIGSIDLTKNDLVKVANSLS